MEEELGISELTPRQIVAELDKHIVGQRGAKRAVAIALRNRVRRRRLRGALADDVHPKNILMIGPTGVGKTEIARRLAKLCDAPFVKVEATKFTEVGYVGRDVDSMVRDLVETAVRMVKLRRMEAVRGRSDELARERLLDILAPPPRKDAPRNPLELLFGGSGGGQAPEEPDPDDQARQERQRVRERLDLGLLEDHLVDVDVEDSQPPMLEIFSGQGMEEMGAHLGDLLGGMLPRRKRKRRMTVAEARKVLAQEEAQKLIDLDRVTAEAVRLAEQSGIVFLDEIDKIAGAGRGSGPDVSREGVQRDILPIVEGSTVNTKYGPVKTDHVLFIAAGAFHVSKPSDLIPELQGRFPIRVELEALGKDDFKRILTEPENALVKQYVALLETEGLRLRFEDSALDEIAELAHRINAQTENIGARRLHTVLEKVLEEASFTAPELSGQELRIDRDYVRRALADVIQNEDLSRYIL